jgi:3',5'-cyclic-AMP phosphodiesterase
LLRDVRKDKVDKARVENNEEGGKGEGVGMKRLAWLTDTHLNFLEPPAVEAFLTSLAETQADAFLIGGDIGEASDLAFHLNALENRLQRPVYFVLGNHDFYGGSIAGVRETVRILCSAVSDLHWLSDEGIVSLTDETCLIGHDGWGDGRLGDYHGSDVMLNDWGLIQEFGGFYEDLEERLVKLHALGDEAAAHFRTFLPDALRRFRHFVVLTHVPPFREACGHEGKISDDNWLPHFTCKAVGDALLEAMTTAPKHSMMVLCGHTHSVGEAQVLPNLRVLTGGATYGHPVIQRVLEVE